MSIDMNQKAIANMKNYKAYSHFLYIILRIIFADFI